MEERLSVNDVCHRLGISRYKIYNMPELNSLKKKENNSCYWLNSDINEYEKKIANKAMIITKEDKMSPKLEVNFKFWIRNMDGTIIYRNNKDINEWVKLKPDANVFNYLHQIEYKQNMSVYQHLCNMYASEIYNGENFLRSKGEEKIIPELSQKVNQFYKHIENDVNFFVPSIESFSNDKDVMTLKFFDLQNLEAGEHKHWDIWEKQLNEDDIYVFRAFIYSIFFAKDKNRQAMWLNDPGKTGKTIVMNAISRYGGNHFGNSLKSESLYRNKHYGTYIEGYRYLMFDDNTNPFLISDGIFKSITGGGQITIDEKGVAGMRSYMPNVKVIISANMKPIIQDQESDLTRVILINVNRPTEEMSEYMMSLYDLENILCNELKYYLYTCKSSYEKLCPTRTHIILNEEQKNRVKECQSSEDSIIANFFNTYFVAAGKNDGLLKTEFDMCKSDYEVNQQVKMDYNKILRYLGSHNIKIGNKKVDNVINTFYIGVKLRGWEFNEGRLEICQNM